MLNGYRGFRPISQRPDHVTFPSIHDPRIAIGWGLMHWLEDSCGKTSWTIAGKHALSPSTLNPCTAPCFLHRDAGGAYGSHDWCGKGKDL